MSACQRLRIYLLFILLQTTVLCLSQISWGRRVGKKQNKICEVQRVSRLRLVFWKVVEFHRSGFKFIIVKLNLSVAMVVSFGMFPWEKSQSALVLAQ